MKKVILILIISVLGFGFADYCEAAKPKINSLSTKHISVMKAGGNDVDIVVYGKNFDQNNHEVFLGKIKAKDTGGDSTGMSVTFRLSKYKPKTFRKAYRIKIKDAQGNLLARSQDKITVFNPHRPKYIKNAPQKFLNKTPDPRNPNKRTVGVGVNWALGGDSSTDSNYRKKLKNSKTKWVREQITYSSWTGASKVALKSRYDQRLLKYYKMNIKTIGLISYDKAQALESEDDYRKFVRGVAKRYRNLVSVWEIQNPSNPMTYTNYEPMLRIASEEIRKKDSDAIILMGAYGFANNDSYLDDLYSNSKDYFDAANLRIDYCQDYKNDGNLNRLTYDMGYFYAQVSAHRADEPVWATEVGCNSDVSGGDTNFIKNYSAQAADILLNYSYMQPVLLQSQTNSDNFGIAYDDGTAWNWYKDLARK